MDAQKGPGTPYDCRDRVASEHKHRSIEQYRFTAKSTGIAAHVRVMVVDKSTACTAQGFVDKAVDIQRWMWTRRPDKKSGHGLRKWITFADMDMRIEDIQNGYPNSGSWTSKLRLYKHNSRDPHNTHVLRKNAAAQLTPSHIHHSLLMAISTTHRHHHAHKTQKKNRKLSIALHNIPLYHTLKTNNRRNRRTSLPPLSPLHAQMPKYKGKEINDVA